jgi:hypothetical protein
MVLTEKVSTVFKRTGKKAQMKRTFLLEKETEKRKLRASLEFFFYRLEDDSSGLVLFLTIKASDKDVIQENGWRVKRNRGEGGHKVMVSD